jgi:DNA-directed RNA polymerase specialized sigma24 family protein
MNIGTDTVRLGLSTLLDADPQAADHKCTELWLDLVRYFRWQGHPDPEDGAQEVLSRGLEKAGSVYPWEDVRRDPWKYFFGFAWFVAREGWRTSREVPLDEEHRPAADAISVQSGVEAKIYLDELLSQIDPEDRDLVIRYHLEDRQELSRTLSIPIGTLRVQVHRICKKLAQLADRKVED